jgi:carboxynorspermidine decarboxylase
MNSEQLYNSVPTSPAFIIDQQAVIQTLKILNDLKQNCGCRVLYSIKSLPLYCVLEWAKPLVNGFAVSSLFEARLADEVLAGAGSLHLTTPGLKIDEIAEISQLCRYISFNSLSQLQRMGSRLHEKCSPGLRINPKLSFAKDARFDPCRIHSKLGVPLDELVAAGFPNRIQGLHFHTVFASQTFTPLFKNVEHIKSVLGDQFAELKWLNFGGGYLFGNVLGEADFIDLVKQLKQDYDFEIFIEPGNVIVGPAGYLLATVTDTFNSDGKTIAVLDTSVNHNPEVFEYQWRPELLNENKNGDYTAILAGSTCLAGDVFGEYRFAKPPMIDDRVVFQNVGAYSLVKSHRFNGYNLPDVYAYNSGKIELIKHYTYRQYRELWVSDE